jgi:hypothetical protein
VRDFASLWSQLPRRLDQAMFAKPADRVCFLDGGGKVRQHKVVAFCGFMCHPVGLEDFDGLWRVWLNHHGLVSLHTAEALSWSGEVWARKRAEWGDKADEQRRAALHGFVSIVRGSPLRAIGYVGDSQFLNEKAQGSQRPDLVMFEKTLETAIAAMSPDGSLTVLSDWEDGFDTLCVRALAKLRMERPEIGRRVQLLGFCDDTAYAALQAADLFAALACRDALRMRERPTEPRDPLYDELIKPPIAVPTSPRPMHEMFDAETFRRMVEAHQK